MAGEFIATLVIRNLKVDKAWRHSETRYVDTSTGFGGGVDPETMATTYLIVQCSLRRRRKNEGIPQTSYG